ncbi:TonB-dependent receptor [Campylobacter blaseri]|uniref:TonB-dependent siderophore receptor n=1 Tax=Campylobacter blaseri TaxID=2042961 RepID=A0A2P8R3Q8_9BACT|nr:TonB-dependent receptor [Campylobacter blaseri]PSM53136.1 TonB-dependent siderophore receptor [Campylobacter blaseri]PSM54602.1 TonB-dependent siderophore receptor [Campylobacter blaseri]QKF86925.1 TonB-dependent receptor [Campylobacter blaseri]
MQSSYFKCLTILSLVATTSIFANESISLEQITVSANKMEENIKDIPQSISVIDENEAEEKRIRTVNEIVREIPNLTSSVFINKTRMNFRGINHSDFTNSNPVTVYIDGIPNSNQMSNYDAILTNIERIEVLRGPQSTIYGKDSIGGVINIITKTPQNEWSGNLGTEYGSNNYMMGSFNANGALVEDKLFLNLGGFGSKDDGWITNDYNNDKKANKYNKYKFDGTITFKPTDRLTARLTLAKERVKDYFYKGGTGNFGQIDRNDAKHAKFEVPTHTTISSFAQSLGIDYEFDKAKFSSITAHKKSNTKGVYDGDFKYDEIVTNNNGLNQFQHVVIDMISQELRLSSLNTDKFKWITGLYFEREKTNNKRMGQQFVQGGFKMELDAPAKMKADTMAIFAQGNYNLTDSLALTLGGRYQKIKKDIDLKFYITPLGMPKGTPVNALNDNTSWSKFLPKAGLTYKINDDLSAFISYSQGYLAGGYNYYAMIKEQNFDPQISNNYEIGLRGNALDNSLRFSVSAFHMDIKDIHMYKMFPGGLFTTSNGGKAKSDGIELEALYRVTNELDISGSLGIIKTKYKENITDSRAIGKRIENTPNYTANLGISYTMPNGIYARADLRAEGSKYFDAANTLKQKSWISADVRAGYRFKDFDIYGYVTNITNEEHIETFLNHGGMGGMNHFNDPRRFGIGLKYSF